MSTEGAAPLPLLCYIAPSCFYSSPEWTNQILAVERESLCVLFMSFTASISLLHVWKKEVSRGIIMGVQSVKSPPEDTKFYKLDPCNQQDLNSPVLHLTNQALMIETNHSI